MQKNWTIIQFNSLKEADGFVLNHGPIPLPWAQLSTSDDRYYVIAEQGCLNLNGHKKSITAAAHLIHLFP